MTDDDIRPFLPIAPAEARPLGAALAAIATGEATSPWSPRPVAAPVAATPTGPIAPVPAAPSADDIAAIVEQARERGHAEGLAQTVAWYQANEWWWRPIKEQDAAFKAYYQAQYAQRQTL